MERRLLSAALILWGLTVAGYLMWCDHRVSMPVLMRDEAWPRPFPYPDEWLRSWAGRIEAENPPPPGFVRCGCDSDLPGRVRAWTVSALFVAAVGVAILLWAPDGRHHSRVPSVRRGIAIGLLVGLAWAAAGGHTEREGLRSVWDALVLWGFGFALTGAAVGAVRSYPELVGLTVSPLAVVVQPFIDRGDRPRILGGKYWKIVDEFLWALAGSQAGGPGEFSGLIVSALFWGLVIGALHRLSRGRQFDPRTLLPALRPLAGEHP